MLIITVAVGLLPLVSTTVDAADYELPYILAINDEVYVSDGIFILESDEANVTSVGSNPGSLRAIGSTTIKIVYSEALSDWVAEEVLTASSATSIFYRYGTSTKYAKATVYSVVDSGTASGPVAYWQAKNVVTNVAWNTYEKAAVGSYSNDLTQLPQGLTEDAIRDIIDEQLNTMSSSGSTATTIINNTTVQYNSYQAGDITGEEMQSYVTSNLDTLSDLTPSTLLDAMQINNAITYNQTIQDELLHTVDGDLNTYIQQRISWASSTFTSYKAGSIDQQDAVNRLQGYSTQLMQQLNTYTSSADVAAINAAVDSINNMINAVGSYSDLSQDSSDKSQASDQAELDYLDELTAETTATVEQLAPSQNFSSSQTGEAQEVFNLIWENEFVKKLLPMCAGFMVVCVVLGIRYKV